MLLSSVNEPFTVRGGVRASSCKQIHCHAGIVEPEAAARVWLVSTDSHEKRRNRFTFLWRSYTRFCGPGCSLLWSCECASTIRSLTGTVATEADPSASEKPSPLS